MPVYEYQCMQCNEKFEVMQKISDDPLTRCESCDGELKKLITNSSFVLKGGGWYVTDYPSEARKKAMDAQKGSSKATEPKSNKKTETKKETAGT